MKDKQVKKGSWKTLYLVYIASADGIQDLCGLYRTHSGAVARCMVERRKILDYHAQLCSLEDKVWKGVYESVSNAMASDNPEEWYSVAFDCPYIKELEVLDEF